MAGRPTIAAFAAVDLSLPQGHAMHVRGLFDALAARGCDITAVVPQGRARMPDVSFRRIVIRTIPFRVLGPWTFEIFGGLRLLIHCLRRRPDVIYARQDLYTTAPGIVGGVLGIPVVVEVDSAIPVELALWGRSRAAVRLAAAAERRSLARASVVIVLSDEFAVSLAGRTGTPREKIAVVPIGTHLPVLHDPRDVRADLGIPEDRFVIGFAGNLTPIQGLDVLIDAFERIANRDQRIGLLIVGEGTQSRELRERAAPLGERIRFFGGRSREETDRILRACQVLVAPYCREIYETVSGGASSSKILTYLALDRPAIVADWGLYSWIETLGAGEAVASSDADALAAVVLRRRDDWLAAGSPISDWPWISPGPGRTYVESNATWTHSAGRVIELFDALIRPGRSENAAPATSGGR